MNLSGTKVLVIGAGGMLAADLIPALRIAGAELVLADLNSKDVILSLDITQEISVLHFVSEHCPQWIVNCAAYTAVDDAEVNSGAAFDVNAQGASHLASAASECGAKLLHLSTDYVFGGAGAKTPFTEDAPTAPLGVYGESKLLGEEYIRSEAEQESLIIRTSWLHGAGGPNFVDTILKLSAEREELKVVDDQIGSPTWTGWLAEVLVKLIAKNASGTFHAASRGGISWCQFAAELVRLAGTSAKISTQTTKELGRAAPRPAYSVLDVSKLEAFLGEPCISWQDGLRAHLRQRGVNC